MLRVLAEYLRMHLNQLLLDELAQLCGVEDLRGRDERMKKRDGGPKVMS